MLHQSMCEWSRFLSCDFCTMISPACRRCDIVRGAIKALCGWSVAAAVTLVVLITSTITQCASHCCSGWILMHQSVPLHPINWSSSMAALVAMMCALVGDPSLLPARATSSCMCSRRRNTFGRQLLRLCLCRVSTAFTAPLQALSCRAGLVYCAQALLCLVTGACCFLPLQAVWCQ